jgi:type VI secretion system protein ImpF
LREVKNSLRRDLEWLLNTRRTPEEPDVSARELWRSVYCYGLPDVSALPLSHVEGQQRLVRLLEAAIAAFEPRLTNVSVTLLPVAVQAKLLRFRIEALLRMEPAPERIFFDTTLELTSGRYEVEADARAR